MNERKPYERHLAEQLQNLPPPGAVDESWEEMRRLLDKEIPRGGGMPGRRRWWFFGIAIGVIFLATWLSGSEWMDSKMTNFASQTLPPSGQDKDNTATGNAKTAIPATGNHTTPGDQNNAVAAGNSLPATADETLTASRGEPRAGTALEEAGRNTAIAHAGPNSNKNTDINFEPIADEIKFTRKNNRTTAKNNHLTPYTTGKKTSAGKSLPGKTVDGRGDNNYTTEKNNTAGKSATNTGSQLTSSIHTVQPTAVQPPLNYDHQPGPVLAPGTIIEKDYALKSAHLLRQPPAAKNAARKKFQKSREAGTLAVGFTLPLAFPLGDQRAMGYNQWAGHNTVSDYIPSPHLQYHLSSKTFFQTEAQLMSPQFIRSTLLYQTRSPLAAGAYTTNSVYAKKLYYFNVPLSIHHSPFPGFYMGTGLQFSSMLSGVALTEEKRYTAAGGNGTLVKETYTRFRNDTLSDRIHGSEFRVLLDANYYFNRFTVGLRYNQALSNYISFRLMPGVPYTFDKNRALLFYLRYNLWEERKGAVNNKRSVLALK